MDPTHVLFAHAAATWGLFGLIWTVQLVLYPGLAKVGAGVFRAYHEHHCARITWIVAPLMAVELLTGLLLIAGRPPGMGAASLALGLGLLASNWVTTAFFFVPLHGRLRPDAPELVTRLVRGNWIRTAAWTARAAWVFLALQALPTGVGPSS